MAKTVPEFELGITSLKYYQCDISKIRGQIISFILIAAWKALYHFERSREKNGAETNFYHIFHLLGITEEHIDEAMSCRTR